MEFADVIFPLNLGQLTYEVPKGLRGSVRPGMLVEAEVRKTIRRGIVLKPCTKPPEGKLKSLKALIEDGPELNSNLLSLMTWMSEYYFAKEGEVLKRAAS